MKNALIACSLVAALSSCISIESTTISPSDVTAVGGEAVAVVQANSIGFTFLFHIVDIVPSDLDQVVNKLLVGEAKGMGASKIDLKSASTTPRHGIFALSGFILGFPTSSAVGVVVK